MQVSLNRVERLGGELIMPGDKSIAHRALILGALASGKQTIDGLPFSQDVASTATCLEALGCHIERQGPDRMTIHGTRMRNGQELDAGNSGTTARLLSGLVAGRGLVCSIDGDESLRRRPMARILQPLSLMGSRVTASEGNRLPLWFEGGELAGISYRPPMASAQVKSAILIAGLFAAGKTTVIEKAPTRDHTEQMLAAMGVSLDIEGLAVTVAGGARLEGIPVTVPGDISSAAFFAAAASIHPNADVRLPGTGVNPTRTGFLEILTEMGARITHEREAAQAGEQVADLRIRSGPLRAIDIGGDIIPRLIDELPVLAVVATQAEGVTSVRDAGELRHKESDRIATIVENLSHLGADIQERRDGFVVTGPTPLRGNTVKSFGDHRIVMAMAIAGLIAEGQTHILGSEVAGVSYPEFFDDLRSLCN
jgi:3-phosphoshikimate 1-carboxyvinyltransferase